MQNSETSISIMHLDALEELPKRIRYTGQQYDQLTEQYYLRARYYNPILGRFIQEDVYQGDGLNLYVYCQNNPVLYYDPSGYDVTENPRFNTPKNIVERIKNTPQVDVKYGEWLGPRGNSYFKVNMENDDAYYEGLIKVLKLHDTDRVKYTNDMIDMEEFVTFSDKTRIYSDRTPTHRDTNKAIADMIIKYKGDYEKCIIRILWELLVERNILNLLQRK